MTSKNIWTIDESGLTAVHAPQKIIVKKDDKQVENMTCGEKGALSMLDCKRIIAIYLSYMLILLRETHTKDSLKAI